MTSPLPSLLISIPDGVIDLGWGHPSPRLHPTDALAAAAQSVLGQQSAVPLQYGAVQGFGPLLESLAAYLSTQEAYGGAVAPESLFLTAGASAAIDLAATLYSTAGDTVIVEEPTYYLIEQIFVDHGLNVVGVPTDANGLDTSALENHAGVRRVSQTETALHHPPRTRTPTGRSCPLQRPPPPSRTGATPRFHRHRRRGVSTAPLRTATAAANGHAGRFTRWLRHIPWAPSPRYCLQACGWDGCMHPRGSSRRFVDSGVAASGGGLSHFSATLAHEMLETGMLAGPYRYAAPRYTDSGTTMSPTCCIPNFPTQSSSRRPAADISTG